MQCRLMTQSRRTNKSRSMAINFVIRTLACSDAQRVMELNAQLGYDADVRQIRVRLDRLGREPTHHLIGVEGPGGLVAFAHFFERPSIEKGFDMVIQSLVVDVTLRGLGIGRLADRANRPGQELRQGGAFLPNKPD